VGKRTSWWCQPTEPGETSQSSSEPSSRAAATWEAQGEVASATTGEGDHLTAPPPQRWTRSLSMGRQTDAMLATAIRAFWRVLEGGGGGRATAMPRCRGGWAAGGEPRVGGEAAVRVLMRKTRK
jgi:hypothetical protein